MFHATASIFVLNFIKLRHFQKAFVAIHLKPSFFLKIQVQRNFLARPLQSPLT